MSAIQPQPAPHPIASLIQGRRFAAGPFWLARLASVIGVVALLWAFHTQITPKLGIYDVRLLTLSLLFATLAVSLNLVNGVTGQFSMGHAAFYLIGAITAGKLTLTYYVPHANSYHPQLWLLLMVVAGGIAAALAGLLVGLPSLRLRGDYLAVATLGFGEIVNVFFRNQDGRAQAVTATVVVAALAIFLVIFGYVKVLKFVPVYKGWAGGLFGFLKLIVALVLMRLTAVAIFAWLGPSLDRFGRLDTGGPTGLTGVPKLTPIYFIILLFIGTIAICRNLLKSAHGLAFLAVREDELAADATGVSTTKIKVTAFAIGAAIAGMAGALLGHLQGSVSPDDFKMDVSFMLVAMVVIGGTGSITGAALAGIGLKLLEEGLRKLQPIPAIDLFSLILAAIAIFAVYLVFARRNVLKLDSTLRIPMTIFGVLASGGLLYLEWVIYRGDLSWILKIAMMATILGSLIGIYFSSSRAATLPRFGLLALSMVLVKFAAPPIAKIMHDISSVDALLGETTYYPSDLRWAVFSFALVVVMLLRSQGLLGHHEYSWTFLKSFFGRRTEALAT